MSGWPPHVAPPPSGVMVRLQVEHMKQEIIAHLSPEAISADIQRAVDQAVAAYDFEGELRALVPTVIRGVVARALEDAANVAVRDPEFRMALADRMLAHLKASV